MPTINFFNMCKRHFGKGNTDTFERRTASSEDVDEEEDGHNDTLFSAASSFDSVGETEEEPPEFELGIRRSAAATSSRIEDVTLSDIILDPDGKITYYWLAMVTVAVIYNIGVIALRLAFTDMRETEVEESVFYMMDTLSDLIYLLDVFVHLRISFYEDGCLVLDPQRIVERYTQSRKFIVDIVSVVPLASLYNCVSIVSNVMFIDLSSFTPGHIQIMIFRLSRLLKYPTMVRFFNLSDSRTRNPNLLRAFKLSLNLWVVIHWVGCVYYVVSEYEGLGANNWVYPNSTEFAPFSRKYIRVMYWSLMTLTTIGERPSPETDLEFVFTGFTFLIGVFVFAAVVGNVGDVISNMNAARTDFQQRMDQIKSYLQHRHVDEKLQNRVKRWADYTWTRTQSIDEPTLLQLLPDRLRTEIAINVHLETLRKVKIFEECEEGLLRELVLKLRPQVYSPGDFICRTGEVGREMFIVNHGKVEIMVPNQLTGKKAVVATLSPGNYFGEISLLKMDDGQNRRTADVRAIGYSELLRLSRKDLMSALVEYPNAKRILEQQAKERIQKTKEIRRSSTTEDISSHDSSSPDDNPLGRRKDLLLNVIKSDNFRSLLSNRDSEIGEIKRLLERIKQFDSQTTQEQIAFLREQIAERDKELNGKNKEILMLEAKVARLVSKDKAFRVYKHHSPVSSPKPYSVSNGEHTPSCSCIKCTDTTERGIESDHGCCISQQKHTGSRKYSLSHLSRKDGSRRRAINVHLTKCPLSKSASDRKSCKCRQLCHSSSVPDVLPVMKRDGSPATAYNDAAHNKHDVNSGGGPASQSDGSRCAPLRYRYMCQARNTRRRVYDVGADTETSEPGSSDPHSSPNTRKGNMDSIINTEEQHMQVIEKLLQLDDVYLSDSSIHSTDHSSDEQD